MNNINNIFNWVASSSIATKLKLRRTLVPVVYIATFFLLSISLTSCEKDFNIKLNSNKPQLVVEAYINNELRTYNYVVLSRSLDYLSTDFQSIPVANAVVTITEGEYINNQYVWNTASKVRLYEANVSGVPDNFRNGVYFDPRLVTDSANALLGTPGKSYLLEINEGGKDYSSIATLLQPVQIDSLTSGFGFIDQEDENKSKVRLTNHYKDPDTLNNTQMYFYRFSENRNHFGWGSFSRPRSFGADDVTNGQDIHLTHSRGFIAGDTVTYHMASVTREVYSFWQSFSNARNNNGPFATPVTLSTNIKGPDATGCFSGFSLSTKTIVMQ